MKKRILNAMLALCLLLILLPTSASAASLWINTPNGYRCQVGHNGFPSGRIVYFVSYDESGRMLKLEKGNPSNINNQYFTAPEGTCYAKAFVMLDSKPLHASPTVLFQSVDYQISFYDGDSLISTKTVTTGPTAKLPAYGELPVPEKAGYAFLGWFTAKEGGEQVTANTTLATRFNISLYARWQKLILKDIPAAALTFPAANNTFTYSQDASGAVGRSAKCTYASVDGVSYPTSKYVYKYRLHGDSEYLDGLPHDAGTYDVTVTRAADDTYKAFEHTYESALVINKGTHYNGNMEFVDIIVEDRGYTWFKLALKPTGYTTVGEEAVVTFHVSTDSGETWAYASDSTHTVFFPQRYNNDLMVCVEIHGDPNWNDWISSPRDNTMYPNHPEQYKYNLLATPETSWADHVETDCFLRYVSGTDFTVTTAEELAGLAYLVNVEKLDFAERTVRLGADIDLRGHEWVPIGNATTQFKGTFDGQGHIISDAYLDDTYAYSGLFGYTNGAWVEDLTLQGAYIAGSQYSGGIIGRAANTQLLSCLSYAKVSSSREGYSTGGCVGLAENSNITKCISYSRLEGMGNVGGIVGAGAGNTVIDSCRNYGVVTNARNATGGVLGTGSGTTVVNCLNYGEVSANISTALGVGGIAGVIKSGDVYNCVNFGPVTGYNTVGGIVGLNETSSCRLYNCCNVGSVWGRTTSYIGAVIGRNQKNEGKVYYCYYQAGSAKYSNGQDVSGAGTKNSSTDSVENLAIGYFTVSQNGTKNVYGHWYGTQGTLMDVLNAWQGANVNSGYPLAKWWITDPSGYPVPYTDAW